MQPYIPEAIGIYLTGPSSIGDYLMSGWGCRLSADISGHLTIVFKFLFQQTDCIAPLYECTHAKISHPKQFASTLDKSWDDLGGEGGGHTISIACPLNLIPPCSPL